MKTRIQTTIDFASAGNAKQHVRAGWSGQEPAHIWMIDGSSTLVVDWLDAPSGYFVEVAWRPASNPAFRTVQPFALWANGVQVATGAVDTTEIVALRCPPSAAGPLTLVFDHPGAFAPSESPGNTDPRALAFCVSRLRILPIEAPPEAAVHHVSARHLTGVEIPEVTAAAERLSGVPPSSLLHGFELLSGNCDMGLAQRALGFEKMSLLRFGGATPAVAMAGLETDFAELGRGLSLTAAGNPIKEWMIAEASGLRFHSGLSSLSVPEAAARQKMGPYLDFLRRKLLADLDEGGKVFVYADHRNHHARRGIEHVMPLYLSLKRRSPGARLLWVVPATVDPGSRGSVRLVQPDLAIGFLDLVAAPVLVGGGITVTGWLNVLVNAWNAFGMTADATGAA